MQITPHRQEVPPRSAWGGGELARWALVLILLVSSTLGPAAEQAEAQPSKKPVPELYGAVILGALKADETRETSEELQEFQEQLQRIFGYDRFRVAKSFADPLAKGSYELKTRHFFMQLEYRGSEPGQGRQPKAIHNFDLKLYQKDELIVESKVEVGEGTPFYVRGPIWGRKEIIFMILVR